ncbi:MAG: glycosyltransferase family 2 protein [Planctomycetes bacterium]|jgi:hypothetical protein|nr:glycosyltransferase family 2 protein [Planctomycetota bacterium]
MDISIIIVNYKSKDKLLRCLDSIKIADWSSLNYEIIVVENNSGDNLSEISQYPNTNLLVSSKNLGMGGGNNYGLRIARGEYVLILNPDTIVQKSAIKVLYNYLKSHEEVGIVGPQLFYPDNTLQFSCFQFPRLIIPLLRRTFLGDYFKEIREGFTMSFVDHSKIMEVDWLMGSCFLMKRDFAVKLGHKKRGGEVFDEYYFMYFEDIDLCRRTWSAGKKVIYNPEAVVIHDHQRASAKLPWYFAFTNKLAREHVRSWLKYHWKWKSL